MAETHDKRTDTHACDLISRQAAISEIMEDIKDRSLHDDPATPEDYAEGYDEGTRNAAAIVLQMPSAQPEPLTDKEQRIFLAAMEREEKVCEEVDRNYVREPYEDSLMRVCKEIRRKVKGALWT